MRDDRILPNRDADKYESNAYGKNIQNKDPNKWIWIIGAFILGTAFGVFLMSL